MTEQELIDLKQEIDKAKEKSLQLKGQKDALLQQLKDDWNCNSIEETLKKIKLLEKQNAELLSEIEEGMSELEASYFKDE
jgi:predicted  nucleic acid-binding Zn-ribbon protein